MYVHCVVAGTHVRRTVRGQDDRKVWQSLPGTRLQASVDRMLAYSTEACARPMPPAPSSGSAPGPNSTVGIPAASST
jgi:hypothetical protein